MPASAVCMGPGKRQCDPVQPLDSVNSDLIVASNLDLRTELAQVLDEVVP